jgi:cytochrome P450/NADPH-cytochrome P450 reductase
VGNVPDIDADAPVQSLMRSGRIWARVFRLTLPGQNLLVLGGHHLVADACDESRFEKHVHGPLEHIRDFAGDGLHRLQPRAQLAAGPPHPAARLRPLGDENYFADMLDIADQMFTKWERLGPEHDIEVPDA